MSLLSKIYRNLVNIFSHKGLYAKPSKIGILYICTGKYHIFWDEFYLSANKFFCKNSEVHYFVYTEHSINTFANDFVHHIYQEKLGWPFDTLKRFHLFLNQREALKEMDYLFFFNANMVFNKPIKENEILPQYNFTGLISVLHPGYYDHKLLPPFEDDTNSEAYVKSKIGLNYYQGCLSGGRTKQYLGMAEKLVEMIDRDLDKNIIGKWWDESYMNKYFLKRKPKSLPPSFANPESMQLPHDKIIIQTDKRNHGGYDFLRS